jgi:hypothetical protein
MKKILIIFCVILLSFNSFSRNDSIVKMPFGDLLINIKTKSNIVNNDTICLYELSNILISPIVIDNKEINKIINGIEFLKRDFFNDVKNNKFNCIGKLIIKDNNIFIDLLFNNNIESFISQEDVVTGKFIISYIINNNKSDWWFILKSYDKRIIKIKINIDSIKLNFEKMVKLK